MGLQTHWYVLDQIRISKCFITCQSTRVFSTMTLIGALFLTGCSTTSSRYFTSASVDASAIKLKIDDQWGQLTAKETPSHQRVVAADSLLFSDHEKLETLLAGEAESQVVNAVAQAVILSMSEPPQALYLPLRKLLLQTDGILRIRLAEALARYAALNSKHAADMIRLSKNPHAPTPSRQAAILVLARLQTKDAAGTLMELTETDQPQTIRSDAFRALALLTGIDVYGQDREQWLDWWGHAKGWSRQNWQTFLTQKTLRQNAQQRMDLEDSARDLLMLARTNYRKASDAEKPEILVDMLTEYRLVRQLAMDFVLERILEGQPVTGELLVALRGRLEDADPSIRRLAVARLNDLADEKAADRVAERLVLGWEQDPTVMRDCLLLLTNMPRGKAVDITLEMLEKPAMSSAAAGMIAEANGQGLLSAEQQKIASQYVHTLISQNAMPLKPKHITLLASVGNDWQLVASFIDSQDDTLKQAAALAWAKSNRSLRRLANRANDPVIQPIVFAAAEKRGKDPSTLLELVKNRPQHTQNDEAWGRALVAMSSRVPAKTVLDIVASFEAKQLEDLETQALMDNMLGAAITRDEKQLPVTPDELISLRLKRGEIRLDGGNTTGAFAEFAEVNKQYEQLEQQTRERFLRDYILTQIRRDEIDGAFQNTKRWFEIDMRKHVSPRSFSRSTSSR